MRIYKDLVKNSNQGQRQCDEIIFIVIQDHNDDNVCHYNVTNNKVVQLIPDENISASVSGPKINKNGIKHGVCTMYNSISIALKDNIDTEGQKLCKKLIMTLKMRYKIKNENILRIKDVTGVTSPLAWQNNDDWNILLKEISDAFDY